MTFKNSQDFLNVKFICKIISPLKHKPFQININLQLEFYPSCTLCNSPCRTVQQDYLYNIEFNILEINSVKLCY